MSILIPPEHKWHSVDVGMELWFDQPPIVRAFEAIENGIAHGYPLCCVLEYALDQIAKRHPFARRGKVPDGYGGVYVPCSQCCEEMGRVYVPSLLRWALIYCGLTIRQTEDQEEARAWVESDRHKSAYDRENQQMYVGVHMGFQ